MNHSNSGRARGVLVAVALLCALPLALSACSAGDDGTAPRADAGVGAQWGACMRDAGYDVQDPDDASVEAGAMAVPSGVDSAEFQTAGAACAEQAGVERKSNADTQKWEREYAKVASCVRERYSDFPEQEPGQFGWDDDYAPAQDPGFQDVVDACMAKHSPDTQSQSVG